MGFGFGQGLIYCIYCFPSKVELLFGFRKMMVCFGVGVMLIMEFILAVSCLALLAEHIWFALRNSTKIEQMSLTESQPPLFDFGYLHNLKKFFRNYHTALLPFTRLETYEGAFYPVRGCDWEHSEIKLQHNDESQSPVSQIRSSDLDAVIGSLENPYKDEREVIYIFNATQFSEKNK
jgi:hypothetical protein